MKNFVAFTVVLVVVWLVWSGYSHWNNAFLLGLGVISCLFVVLLCRRMKILDDETVPLWLGVRPFTRYLPWLVKEVVESNVVVTRLILDPELPIHPMMVEVHAGQRTELGRVILANSITLTPGTVSVDVRDDVIRVHALSLADAEQDISGEMDRRVTELEGRSQ